MLLYFHLRKDQVEADGHRFLSRATRDQGAFSALFPTAKQPALLHCRPQRFLSLRTGGF